MAFGRGCLLKLQFQTEPKGGRVQVYGVLLNPCGVLSSVRHFPTPRTIARQAPLSMGFSRPEFWSGLPFPPPGDLPDPGIEPASPALAGGFFTTSATWETLTACLTMVLLEGPWIQNIRTNFLNYGISVGQHCGG